jgi:hypothetical protein
MAHFEKHFTVDEANALLPHVLSVFEQIHSIREELSHRQEELAKLHKAFPGNGGTAKGAELVTFSESVARLVAGLEENGVLVKDVDSGLCDFPHIREGEEVFLCWMIGEKTIGFWHEIESGYRGRQPL